MVIEALLFLKELIKKYTKAMHFFFSDVEEFAAGLTHET